MNSVKYARYLNVLTIPEARLAVTTLNILYFIAWYRIKGVELFMSVY